MAKGDYERVVNKFASVFDTRHQMNNTPAGRQINGDVAGGRWVAFCKEHLTVEGGPNKVAQIARARTRAFCAGCQSGRPSVSAQVEDALLEAAESSRDELAEYEDYHSMVDQVVDLSQRRAQANRIMGEIAQAVRKSDGGPQRPVKQVAPGIESVTETLSCGHELEFPTEGYAPAKRRRCAGCLTSQAVS